MVKNPAVERLDSSRKMSCGSAVGVAGARIAARMIVREDYSGAAVQRCIGDDDPQRKCCSGFVAEMPGEMDTARVAVDMRNPKYLAGRICIFQAVGEEIFGGHKPVKLRRRCGTLISHGCRCIG